MIDINFYQELYDSGKSLDVICSEFPEAKRKRYFLQKNLKFRSRSKAVSLAKIGKSLSPYHREQVSAGMKRYFEKNPNEIPYRKYHHSKGRSYPEKLFANTLNEMGVFGWIQEYQHSIYTYDFAFPDVKVDIEIDGKTHLLENVKALDLRRDLWSKEQGWHVLRFSAKQVNENVKECVLQVIGTLTQLRRVSAS